MKNAKNMAKEIDDDSYEHPTHTANRLSKSAYKKKTKAAHIAAVKAHKAAYKHHGSLEVQSYRTYYWQKYHLDNVSKHESIIGQNYFGVTLRAAIDAARAKGAT